MSKIATLPFPVDAVHSSPELPLGTLWENAEGDCYMYARNVSGAALAAGNVLTKTADEGQVSYVGAAADLGVYAGVAKGVVADDEYFMALVATRSTTCGSTAGVLAGDVLTLGAAKLVAAKTAATEEQVGVCIADEAAGVATVKFDARNV